jgi:hypothetical protein
MRSSCEGCSSQIPVELSAGTIVPLTVMKLVDIVEEGVMMAASSAAMTQEKMLLGHELKRVNKTWALTIWQLPVHTVALVLDGRCVTASAVNPGHRKMKMTASTTSHNKNDVITILGFGSLLSERSSRTTFPDLQNFRLGRVPNYRRVFGHPASIFFQRGIANLETKEISSLSAEPCPGHAGFVCSVFDVPSIGTDIMNTVYHPKPFWNVKKSLILWRGSYLSRWMILP